jgi:hypothetical protein
MTNPESAHQDDDLDTESSTDEAPAEINKEQAEALLSADYETRMREFDNVETATPVVSLPVESSDRDESDLTVPPPGGQSG